MREIREIQAALQSSDSQDRLLGVRAVRKGDSAVALPMLPRKVKDGEFMVRCSWRWDGGRLKLRKLWPRC
ncbi:hypothetical protein [Microcoleus sp. POL10_C6]|uniref:hypothetical protein n=1 Tax=Microcoleus sp. POL10_C6 TaxID=2818852 RepID=UPI002FD44C41